MIIDKIRIFLSGRVIPLLNIKNLPYFFAGLAALAAVYLIMPYPDSYLTGFNRSIRILDRNEELLLELTPYQSGFMTYTGLDKISPGFLDLLLYSEDRKYYQHIGIRPLSMARAMAGNIKNWRFVSGGSTITQQLVKIRCGIKRNNWLTKFLEIFRALRLNIHFSKRDILESYINQVFMGNHTYGVGEAARVYFNKEAYNLSLLESAALICVIREPNHLDLRKNMFEAQAKALELLENAKKDNIISLEDLNAAKSSRLNVHYEHQNQYAPHFALWALEEARKLVPEQENIKEVITTLDLKLYLDLVEICKNRIRLMKKNNAHDLGLVCIDNQSMEVLAMVGSLDYYSEGGMINAALIKRQAASTMKAFTYALALDSGQFTASTVLPDIYTEFPSVIGKYIPRNYNSLFHGPVRLSVAFGSSYNVPAVYTLNKIGLHAYYNFLKKVGFDSIEKPADYYGLGLTLGNADVTLLELVRAYSIFPNSGKYGNITGLRFVRTAKGKVYKPVKKIIVNVIQPETAFLISHILSDYKYKAPGFGANSPIHFPFPLAVKTGTSKDFRDNFIVAFDKNITLGIWNGNLTGEPMRNLPTAVGGGIILRDIAIYLSNHGHSFSQAVPDGLNIVQERICKLSGMLAGPECDSDYEYFIKGTEPKDNCDWHHSRTVEFPDEYMKWASENYIDKVRIKPADDLRIIYPVDGDIFQISAEIPDRSQQITFKANSKYPDVVWFINGRKIAGGKNALWQLQPGEFQVEACADSGNVSNSIKIIVVKE